MRPPPETPSTHSGYQFPSHENRRLSPTHFIRQPHIPVIQAYFLAIRMFALMRSSSSAVVASGEGWRLRCLSVSIISVKTAWRKSTFFSHVTHSSCVHVSGSKHHHQPMPIRITTPSHPRSPLQSPPLRYLPQGAAIRVDANTHNNGTLITKSRKRGTAVVVPPCGSWPGNRSAPQMLQAATPVTIAAKAKKGACGGGVSRWEEWLAVLEVGDGGS